MALLIIRIAAADGVHVHVEAGQFDHADLIGRAVGLFPDVENFALRFAVLQFDLLAHELDDLAARLVGGNDFQPQRRAALAADQIDRVVELHIDDIDDFARLRLRPRR